VIEVEPKQWQAPTVPENVRLNSAGHRLYIDVSRDLFDTFGALKKALDTWETAKEPQKEFTTQAVRIPILINELAQITGDKHFAGQVVRQIYYVAFCSDRPVPGMISH
jgi:hypothetical protein